MPQREGLTPLAYMRRYGAFEVQKKIGRSARTSQCHRTELEDTQTDAIGRVFTRVRKPAGPNIVPLPTPDGDAEGRRLVGIEVDGKIVRGFPTPSGRLEFYSKRLKSGGGQSMPCQRTSRAISTVTTLNLDRWC